MILKENRRVKKHWRSERAKARWIRQNTEGYEAPASYYYGDTELQAAMLKKQIGGMYATHLALGEMTEQEIINEANKAITKMVKKVARFYHVREK